MTKILLKKESGDPNIIFFTKKTGLLVGIGYVRVVTSTRGTFIEFTEDQIWVENLYIPYYAKYRLTSKNVYYIEYRTIKDDVMVYYQIKKVSFADYKVGRYYIDPKNLLVNGEDIKIDLMKEIDKNQTKIEKFI